MARIKIKIMAESPLSLGTTKSYGGTLIETGVYIAGAQLRGALGALKRYASQDERKELDRLLGTDRDSGVSFPNCYLTGDPDCPSFPAPLTTRTCKRKPGLKSLGNHGAADTLLMQLAYDHVARDENGQYRIPLPFQYKCPECGDRTESYTKIIEYRGLSSYGEVHLSAHRQTRVAINRARLTAEEGQLYSVRALDEGSRFIGLIEVDAERAELLKKWLPQIARLGGRASRGFGKVKLEVGNPLLQKPPSERCEEFNRKYREFQEDLQAIADDPPPVDTRLLFTVNLRSDALLRDRLGLPTLRLDEAMLLDLFPDEAVKSIKLKLIAQFAQPQHISGWQTEWKLPKEVLLAAQMGGLYVFAAESNKEKLIEWLGKLEAGGIGEMREDGFGQVAICDPFHLEVNRV